MTQEGLAVQRVYMLPKWIFEGIGVNGGGEYVGNILINGAYKRVYVSCFGAKNKCNMPGYFVMDNNGFNTNGKHRHGLTWYRLPYTGGWDIIKGA